LDSQHNNIAMSNTTDIPLLPHPLDEDYQYLQVCRYQENPHVIVVSLDRPRKLNAIHAVMWREIGDAFSKLGRLGDGCRCVLLRGNRSFCSGIDFRDPNFSILNGAGGDDDGDGTDDVARKGIAFSSKLRQTQACFTAIETCPVPVVAAMHGVCIGAGIDMVCCADIRLATHDTTFSVREVQLGLAADVGTLQRLPKIVGHSSRVNELCLMGTDFDGTEAHRIGFISRIYESHVALMQGAIRDVCCVIAKHSPLAVTGTKQSLLYTRDHSVQEGLEQIILHNVLALQTDDIIKTLMAKQQQQQKRQGGNAQDMVVPYEELPIFSKL